MSLAEPIYWYVRKAGWTQGPFQRDQILHMYATSWISRVDRVANSPDGPWSPLHTVLGLGEQPDTAPPPTDAVWEIASQQFHGSQPVSYGMLQMIAAAGKLGPADLIRRVGDARWQPAASFAGVFGGPRAWCTACGFEVDPDWRICPHCQARQPAFEPSLATFAFTCGVVACVWSVVATITVIALALRRATILGVALDEDFPEAFAIFLAPAAMCAILAVTLARLARRTIREGRSAPAHLPRAITGEWLGWTACLGLTLVAVAVTAFGVAHFQIRP